jgi:glycosyltransferase involved in cell wall biosynthesis
MGVDVVRYEKFNDDINTSTLKDRVSLALNGAWSASTYSELLNLIKYYRPDIAHFHNTFPQISPSAYAACRNNGVAVVQTLHNFRLVCAEALLTRNGKQCEKCLTGNVLRALFYRCYRGEFLASAAMVWLIESNKVRGSYKRNVDRYIALTKFGAEKFKGSNIPSEKIVVEHNFLPDPPTIGSGSGGYAVFVGRLSQEKGLNTLLEAWKRIKGMPLKLVGDGPMRTEIEQAIATHDIDVELLGYKDKTEVYHILRSAVLQVIPSECYEGFPLVVLEALASGTPLVVSRLGGLDEIIEDEVTGMKFEPKNPHALFVAVERLRNNTVLTKNMRKNARQCFDKNFTEGGHYLRLIDIYKDAIYEYQASSV